MHHMHHLREGDEGSGHQEGGPGRRGARGDGHGLTLDGLRVAVTRPAAGKEDGRLQALLRERGARPLSFPTTALVPPQDPEPLRSAARRVADYDWIVVTSRNTVPHLLEALEEAGTLEEALAGSSRPRVCAVGPRTAEALRKAGFSVDLVPERFVAEGVVEAVLGALGRPGGRESGIRVLYPRAAGARDVIPRGLREAGARVDAVEAYRSVESPEGARDLAAGVARGKVDVVTFTAGSTGRSFAAAWREEGDAWPPAVGVVAMGPATAAALRKEGLPVHAAADPHTLEGLVAAVEAWARETRKAPDERTGEGEPAGDV